MARKLRAAVVVDVVDDVDVVATSSSVFAIFCTISEERASRELVYVASSTAEEEARRSDGNKCS